MSIFIFPSCSLWQNHQKTELKTLVIYPQPPDTARIQFLTSISTSAQVTKKQNWFIKLILGEVAPMPILKPFGMATSKGKIYICDKGVDGIDILDLKKNSFEYFTPTGLGQLRMPLNCFADTNGFLYVADVGRFQVVIFDSLGNYVNKISIAENFKPTDVFVTGDKIWVANMMGHQIHVFSKDSLKLLFSFTESESGGIDYLYSPTHVYVRGEKVYVTDFGDSRIKIFSQDGIFLDTIGSPGLNPGQLTKPKGIAVDHDSNVYVVDVAFENVQIFNKEGNLLLFFGGPYKGPGDMWLPAKVVVDYDNLEHFRKYVDPGFDLKYLIFVTNQFGPDKLNVYGRVEPAKPGETITETGNTNKKKRRFFLRRIKKKKEDVPF